MPADEVHVPIMLSREAVPPEYATPGAAGLDLRTREAFVLAPMQRRQVQTGLHVAIPEGYEAQIRPRSGLASRHGISMVNTPGTIDSDYRGEIGVLLINFGETDVEFHEGDRIGQLVLCPVARIAWEVVADLPETERGTGGFGSTGR
jgi:dUTP pyrophosphatase